MNENELKNRYIFWRHDNRPMFFMMVGIPGSGKTEMASRIYCENKNGMIEQPIIHSTDELRMEMFNSCELNSVEEKQKLYDTIHKRIKADLANDKNVIYDATNLNKKVRAAFLNEIKKTNAYKQCIVIMTPYEVCQKRNQERDLVVPEKNLKKYYQNFMPPTYKEGWNDILIICDYGTREIKNKYKLNNLLSEMNSFEQKTEFHQLTVGEHCKSAMKHVRFISPDDHALQMAAMMHDCGKLHTQTNTNAKGEVNGNSHFYQHHCVGAYESLLYLNNEKVPTKEQIDVANIIYYHMHPSTSWAQSKRALKRDMNLMEDRMYERIMILHDADKRSKIIKNKNQTLSESKEDKNVERER